MVARPSKLVQRMLHQKSTKGTHVYVPEDETAMPQFMRSGYFLKAALPDPPPPVIALTIEF